MNGQAEHDPETEGLTDSVTAPELHEEPEGDGDLVDPTEVPEAGIVDEQDPYLA